MDLALISFDLFVFYLSQTLHTRPYSSPGLKTFKCNETTGDRMFSIVMFLSVSFAGRLDNEDLNGILLGEKRLWETNSDAKYHIHG